MKNDNSFILVLVYMTEAKAIAISR